MHAARGAAMSAETDTMGALRGRVGMCGLIVAESAIFTIFVVAYLFYLGKSVTGPLPGTVLHAPVALTICLLSSSVSVHLAAAMLRADRMKAFVLWWGLTIALGAIFLGGTAREWHHLIVDEGLTIATNLFGTTYYSLVGLHAFHVTRRASCIVDRSPVRAGWAGPNGARRTHRGAVALLAFRRCGLGRRVHRRLRHWKVSERISVWRTEKRPM